MRIPSRGDRGVLVVKRRTTVRAAHVSLAALPTREWSESTAIWGKRSLVLSC